MMLSAITRNNRLKHPPFLKMVGSRSIILFLTLFCVFPSFGQFRLDQKSLPIADEVILKSVTDGWRTPAGFNRSEEDYFSSFSGFNFDLDARMLLHPIILNESNIGGSPTSRTGIMGVLALSAGADYWITRTSTFNASVGGGGAIGLVPVEGINLYLEGGLRASVEVGGDKVKGVLSGDWMKRLGAAGMDYATFSASATNPSSSFGKNLSGEFDYSTVRMGLGVRAAMDGENVNEELNVLIKLNLESPSFSTTSLFKEPIFSYTAEMFNPERHLIFGITYSPKFYIPGKRLGNFTSLKDQPFVQMRLGYRFFRLKAK